MRDAGHGYDVSIGMKRKRVVSGSENTSNARGARSASRAKRRRAMPDSSEEEHASGMDVDEHDRWNRSDNSEDEDALDSCTSRSFPAYRVLYSLREAADSYLINEAPSRRLLRLRKDELVRLYEAAGLTEDAELLTKPEIVDCIIAARDDVADLPPSSPGVGDSGSSDYSSDGGGHVAGGEETDFGNRFRNGLRRRATLHDLGRSSRRHMPDRCLSMSHIQHHAGDLSPSQGKRKRGSADLNAAEQPSGISTRRSVVALAHCVRSPYLCPRRGFSNASSSRSSPTSSVPSTSLPSPPATRLRTRKASGEVAPSPSSSTSKKGKGKHVGFSESVQISRLPSPEQDESDLTDLTEVESSLRQYKPSPRRLRSKGSVTRLGHDRQQPDEASEANRRVTPMRKAKGKIGNLHESTDEEGNEEDELLSSDPEGDDVDQLDEPPSPMATPKAKPPRGRHTPVRNRLRARHLQTHTPPSDGDDEESEEEGTVVAGEEGDDEGSVEDEEIVPDEPRRLRNGKVVGDDDIEEDIGDEDEEEDDDEDEEEDVNAEDSESTGSTADDTETLDGDDGEEAMEDDDGMSMPLSNGRFLTFSPVDLTVATAKTLLRMRRDDLVRLCETRELDVSGTKPQLAEALLQWRDRHCSEATTSAPSSTGTARPPSTARVPRRRKTRSNSGSRGRSSATPPVLLRSQHVHLDEPRTPPLSVRHKEKDGEGELELDLESLGLDDREIPPEKLTKLEKIGSGGFKDVYIGKFKGRRVAIAEFRGQLSSSTSPPCAVLCDGVLTRRSAVDIKELKLLGDFDHPNIVRFVRLPFLLSIGIEY